MDAQRTGKLINYLRSKKAITQKELAAKINVSDKAVSKWERGDGCPDVGILPSLANELGTNVDSLIKGELDENPSEIRILTEEELKAEIAKMEAAGTLEKPVHNTSLLKNPQTKIYYYDFKRPDLFSKYELRKICNMFEMLCEKFRNELAGNRTDLLGIKVCAVDNLTNEEFIKSLPQRTFFYTYDYNNNGFAIEVDPHIGKVLLKQDYKKYPELTQSDSECLKLTYINTFVQIMQDMIYSNTDKSISRELFTKAFSSELNTLLPWSAGQTPGEMCVLVTLELISDSASGMINIQFNYSYFSHLCRKAGLFGNETPFAENLTDIKARPKENNLFVEFGRFVSDSVKLDPGTLLKTSKKYGTPLNVIVQTQVSTITKKYGAQPIISFESKVLFGGEAVIAGENFAVRITEKKTGQITTYDEEHYIAIRLGGTYISEEDLQKIGETYVLQLDSVPGKPVSIIQDGKCVARGEIIILDDTYAVRIVE